MDNTKRYLYDRFLNFFRKNQKKQWDFKSFFNCENGGLEFIYSYYDKIHDEGVTIHGFSFHDLTFLSSIIFELTFVETNKSYFLTFELNDEDDDRELLEDFSNEVYDSIINLKRYQFSMNMISQYYDWGADVPRKRMCLFLKNLIDAEQLLIDRKSIFEENNEYIYYFQGHFKIFSIEIKICSDYMLNTHINITKQCLNFGYDEDFKTKSTNNIHYDYLKVNIEKFLTLYYEKEQCEEIRSLVDIQGQPIINIEDIIIRTSLFQCLNRSHHLLKVGVIVYVDNGVGITKHIVNAFYCSECNQYYISELEYNRLCAIGRICCKVVTIEEYKNIQKNGYANWEKQGLLNCYGYNVNAVNNLSTNERQRILSFIIENNIKPIEEVIDFLTWLSTRPSSMRSNMANARKKWQSDIDYLENYIPMTNVVIAGSLHKKKYIKKNK